MTHTDPNPADQEDSGRFFDSNSPSANMSEPEVDLADAETLAKLADPDAIDSLLEILPEDTPAVSPQIVATRIRRSEMTRLNRVSRVSKAAAFSLTFVCVTAGWYAGSRFVSPEERPNRPPPGFLLFHGLSRLQFDEEFRAALFETSRPSVWDDRKSESWKDLTRIAADGSGIDANDASSLRKSILSHDFDMPEADRERWKKLAERVEAMPPSEEEIVRHRIVGMRRSLAVMTDAERQTAGELSGGELWDFLEQKTRQQNRIADTSKRPFFSISELNRPDYLMDLALVTRAWSRLTPAQKRSAERRAITAKTDPTRKTERLRLLAQSLEADGMDPPAAKPGTGRAGPFQKALAKAEALKQEREKRRAEFQKIIAGNLPAELPPEQLEVFLESMPPWLIESIDPMPPDEARRLLSLLKVLVGNLDEPANEASLGR